MRGWKYGFFTAFAASYPEPVYFRLASVSKDHAAPFCQTIIKRSCQHSLNPWENSEIVFLKPQDRPGEQALARVRFGYTHHSLNAKIGFTVPIVPNGVAWSVYHEAKTCILLIKDWTLQNKMSFLLAIAPGQYGISFPPLPHFHLAK